MELDSTDIPKGGMLRLNRVRHATKEKRVSIEDFKAKGGKDPELGQTVLMDGELPGIVKGIADGAVVITFDAADGTMVRTPVGPGKVRDAGKGYDIVIEAKQGDLMRVGPLVGRVKYVDDRNMDIDFSKTFGGEKLHCDVAAEMVTPAPAAAPVQPKQTEANGNETPAAAEKKETPSPEALQRGVNILQKAIADAAREGKSSISIDADAMDALIAPAGKGDLVTLRFTAREKDGASISLPEDTAKQGVPIEVMAGNEEVFPGLGDAVVGMAAGEKKQIILPPERAYGPRNPANIAKYPLQNPVPRKFSMPAEEYVKRFGGFPSVGKEVQLLPYVTAKVGGIGEKDVTIDVSAKDGEKITEPFGTVTVSVGKENITIKLDPKIGGPFNPGDRQGVITGSDSENFTVDFNHPLAGKTIVADLEVLSVTRVANLKTAPINWIENHDAGLAEAKKEGKPLFLLLYADWCHWCQKTQSETLTDPRIGKLSDRFVWMRLNSDKEQKYKKEFGQNGFPMMVILKPDGTVLKKIDGYRDASRLASELKGVL